MWPFRRRNANRDRYWVSIALKVSVATILLVVASTLLVYLLTAGGSTSGQRWILAVALGILGAGLMFTLVLDRIVTKPVVDLSLAAMRMADGDFDSEIPPGRRDEVGDLAASMEALRRSFLQQKTELEQLNVELDKRVQDRTEELRNAQQRLIQSERLASVGRLASGVAHEINNPTGVILTRAEFLLDTADEVSLDEEAREDLEAIERNAKRIARITTSLLNFSRQAPTELAPVDVSALVDEALSLVSHDIKQNEIEVLREIPSDLPAVKGDRGRLEQVFVNLCKNGIDAMVAEGGGTLTVQAALVAECIEICVRDTGPGLPTEVQDQIFEPFFTTKEQGKGTGLGLSISYGIVADHDGEIRLDSKPGEGAAFTVVLPRWVGEEPQVSVHGGSIER